MYFIAQFIDCIVRRDAVVSRGVGGDPHSIRHQALHGMHETVGYTGGVTCDDRKLTSRQGNVLRRVENSTEVSVTM